MRGWMINPCPRNLELLLLLLLSLLLLWMLLLRIVPRTTTAAADVSPDAATAATASPSTADVTKNK